MLKNKIKAGMQFTLSYVGQQQWKFPPNRLLILMYHRIMPANHPEINFIQPGMVVEPDTFHMHLIELKKLFTMVYLDEWINKVKKGEKVPAKACAITFDDGWKDNFEYAFPILQKAQVPATIYLVTDMVGTKDCFWPERLGRLLYNNGKGNPDSFYASEELKWIMDIYNNLPEEKKIYSRSQIDNIIVNAKRYSDETIVSKLDKIEVNIGTNISETRDILNWAEIKEMVKSEIIHFGSHTRRHTRLTDNISEKQLKDEIFGSKEKLMDMLNIPIKTFCFPNGDFTIRAKKIAQDTYDGACTTKCGWNSLRSDPYELNRIGVHQDIAFNRRAFLSRLSGWI